jgi:hypothetical protein
LNVTIITQQLNNPKPLLFKAENHASNKKLNLNRFEMVEDMELKILHRGSLEWHYLHPKFHENL